jgi:hypothetical protein
MCLSARSLIDESALIAACSMRQAREATTSISRWPSGDLSMFARIFRASSGDTLEIVLILGLNQQPARSGPSVSQVRLKPLNDS